MGSYCLYETVNGFSGRTLLVDPLSIAIRGRDWSAASGMSTQALVVEQVETVARLITVVPSFASYESVQAFFFRALLLYIHGRV
jgi:tRNA(Met) C34 N-acetyltransferase TmcA